MTPRQPYFPSLTAESACAQLREVGLRVESSEIQIERRDDRWTVLLPGDRIAWFAANARGHDRLVIERRVLRLLAERCTFHAPRVLCESASGFDIRAMVVGRCDPWGYYRQLLKDSAFAREIGHAVGNILREQHTRIIRADVEGWLPQEVNWPEPTGWIMERIADIVDDRRLIADVGRMLEIYEHSRVDPADRVLVHADLGLHNLAFDPSTRAVRGIFDYDGAAWADRHHDFRYLVLGLDPEHTLEAALAVYEAALGCTLDRGRIWLYNSACAASFLASRRGRAPDEKWCGRTLDEDLQWTRDALSRVSG